MNAAIKELSSLMPRLRATQTRDGGLRRQSLVDELASNSSLCDVHDEEIETSPKLPTFMPDELDFILPALRVGVSVQAGRAWTNNGAMVGLLASASCPDVDWHIAVVPEQYKGTKHLGSIVVQMSSIRDARGIYLDLLGCIVLPY